MSSLKIISDLDSQIEQIVNRVSDIENKLLDLANYKSRLVETRAQLQNSVGLLRTERADTVLKLRATADNDEIKRAAQLGQYYCEKSVNRLLFDIVVSGIDVVSLVKLECHELVLKFSHPIVIDAFENSFAATLFAALDNYGNREKLARYSVDSCGIAWHSELSECLYRVVNDCDEDVDVDSERYLRYIIGFKLHAAKNSDSFWFWMLTNCKLVQRASERHDDNLQTQS